MGKWIGVVATGILVLSIWISEDKRPSTHQMYTKPSNSYTTKELRRQYHQAKRKKKINRTDRFRYDKPEAYYDLHRSIRTRESEEKPAYTRDYRLRAMARAFRDPHFLQRQNARTGEVTWMERGPSNVPGRVRALVALPENGGNTWLAGAVGGGIWKTEDAGVSWSNKTPDLPSLAISWMDYSAADPDVVYASTGETVGGGRGLAGNGVYKSIDGGESWNQLPSTANDPAFTFINRVIVDPEDPDIVLICTSQGPWEEDFRSGIYRSTDGGTNWTKVYDANRWVFQIIANPGNFGTLYASLWGRGILKSTDRGVTWREVTAGFKQVFGRIELAAAPSDTTRLYAAVQGDLGSAGADLYTSFDAGETWSFVQQKFEERAVDFFGGQGNYDNTIAVDPYNANQVYYGGVSLWKTILSGSSQSENIQTVSVHIALDDLSAWDFVNFGAEYYNGKLELGEYLPPDDVTSIEVRTGPGIGQRAHRFTVGKRGAGVPESGYRYQDYVDIPVEVWDIDNDRQLMVSFRDQQEDSVFNLLEQYTEDGDEDNHSREYLHVHDVAYAETPDENIAQDGGENIGHTYRQMYFFWPVLRTGLTWDPDDLPEDTVRFSYEILTVEKRFGTMQQVSDAYGQFQEDLNAAYSPEDDSFVFHPDHHNLIMIPVNEEEKTFRVLNANDGGVYISNTSAAPGIDNGDWTFSGNSFNTGQFYSATKRPGSDQYIGGLQDNGTWMSPSSGAVDAGTAYVPVLPGDGFDVLWHYTDPNKVIGSSQNNNFSRSDDGGQTWTSATTGLEGVGPFFSKLASSKSHPDRIYTVSSRGVFRSDDFGRGWTLVPITSGWNFSNFIEVKVSDSNPDIVWAGTGMSATRGVHVSVDGGRSFARVPNYTGAEFGILSGMATHPTEDSTAYVLFSFANGPKILQTEDLGQTWTDISGFGSNNSSSNGFPDVAVYSLLVRPDDPDVLWAGTEIGLFESIDDGGSWSFLPSSFGSAGVWEMQVVDDQVVVATHGRGIFTATLDAIPETVFVPVITGAGTSVRGDLNVGVELLSTYDSVIVTLDGQEVATEHAVEQGEALFTISGISAGPDSIQVGVIACKEGKKYNATPINTILFEVGSAVTTYFEDFNSLSLEDFVGFGFVIEEVLGFDNGAIHSEHPYREGSDFPGQRADFIHQLRKPVVVGARNPVITYNNIAVVEPGEFRVAFPDEDFYDYVVIEGSLDGVSWKPLINGYDAARNSKWTTAFENGESGRAEMFASQKVNLHNTFQVNDTIFVRFRLYSDPFTTGWGWAIDDLSIQPVVTALEHTDVDVGFKVYPNPSDGYVKVHFNLEHTSVVRLTLVDVQGKIRHVQELGNLPDGRHEIDMNNAGLDRGLYVLRLETEDSQETVKMIVR